MNTETKAKAPKTKPIAAVTRREKLAEALNAAVPDDLRERLYRAPVGVKGPTTAPIRVYGGNGYKTPLVAQVMLDVGWCLTDRVFEPDHYLEVYDPDGKDVTPEQVVRALRWRIVRCYCDECLAPQPYDDARIEALRQRLAIRASVGRANGVRLTGDKFCEAKLDTLLEVNPKGETP